MLVPFESLSAQSRLWIYQSDRKISKEEQQIISDTLHSFIDSWLVHGLPMTAGFTTRFEHFVIVGADEQVNAASGCSIDKAVRQMTDLGNTLNIDWFNRGNVGFYIDDEVTLISLKNLKEQFTDGRLSGSSLVFDNTIQIKSDLDRWIVPSSDAWVKRYLPLEKLTP
jgi:hypothetical protein